MKISRIVLGVAVLAIAASGCGRYLQAAAAVVDGKTISLDELDRRVDAALPEGEAPTAAARLETQRRELGQMIQDRIVEAEAGKRKIEIPADQVEQRFQEIRGQFPSEEQFNDALRQQGVNPADVRNRIRTRLVVEKIQQDLATAVKIADVDVRNVYGRGENYEEARVRHILFRAQSPAEQPAALRKAQDALRRIRAGEDFAAIARALSEDPGSKDAGGDLGALQRGQTVPEFERVAFAQRPGQISEPVRSQFGYHIIQTVTKTKRTLAQVAPEIREQLQQQRAQEAFQEFIAERIKEADVQVNPRFGRFDPDTLTVVDRQFFTPASPPAEPEGIPGLQLPIDEDAPAQ